MLKNVLLTVSLASAIACQQVPEFPEIVQYGVHSDVEPAGFYGVNNKTKERVYRPFTDPAMKGAQCMSLEDYRKSEAWAEALVELAKQRCQ